MRIYLSRLLFLLLAASTLLPAGPVLLSHVVADTSVPGVWSYTVFNDEPPGSANDVFAFNVQVNAPVGSVGVPAGWEYVTDFSSFVLWSNSEPAPPYLTDIRPGASLSGFKITSPGATSGLNTGTVLAWDTRYDMLSDARATLLVSSPQTVAVPEPALTVALGGVLAVMLMGGQRVRGLVSR